MSFPLLPFARAVQDVQALLYDCYSSLAASSQFLQVISIFWEFISVLHLQFSTNFSLFHTETRLCSSIQKADEVISFAGGSAVLKSCLGKKRKGEAKLQGVITFPNLISMSQKTQNKFEHFSVSFNCSVVEIQGIKCNCYNRSTSCVSLEYTEIYFKK